VPSIFSRIVAGEIPAIKVYEDATTLAFLDIHPASRGHILVISKAEYADLFDIPADTLAAVHATVQRVALAIRDVLAPDGINIIQNNGAAAGQTIFHYHVHLIPRWEGDGVLSLWEPGTTDFAALEAFGTQIRAALA
jgi:histidine triad (HIT) family protein